MAGPANGPISIVSHSFKGKRLNCVFPFRSVCLMRKIDIPTSVPKGEDTPWSFLYRDSHWVLNISPLPPHFSLGPAMPLTTSLDFTVFPLCVKSSQGLHSTCFAQDQLLTSYLFFPNSVNSFPCIILFHLHNNNMMQVLLSHAIESQSESVSHLSRVRLFATA